MSEPLDLANVAAPRASLIRVEIEDRRLTGAMLPQVRRVSRRSAWSKQLRFERCDLTEADFSNARLDRFEFRRCTRDGLRGAAMTWEDVIGGAGPWVAALGIGILGDE